MSDAIHPAAPHVLPRFIPGPDGSDPFFTGIIWGMIILLLIIGNLYLRLHALPERMAHRDNHTQMQAVAILAVIALFTHNNIYWVAALLLAAMRFPDFVTPLNSMSESLSRLSRHVDRLDAEVAARPGGTQPNRDLSEQDA